MKLLRTELPETPVGKRTVRINIYGNVVGYVSGKRFWEFGSRSATNEADAEAWKNGASLESAMYERFTQS